MGKKGPRRYRDTVHQLSGGGTREGDMMRSMKGTRRNRLREKEDWVWEGEE